MSEEMKRIWAILNKHGIYTQKELEKEMRKTVLDIGIFTTPLNKDKHYQEV